MLIIVFVPSCLCGTPAWILTPSAHYILSFKRQIHHTYKNFAPNRLLKGTKAIMRIRMSPNITGGLIYIYIYIYIFIYYVLRLVNASNYGA